MIKKNFSRQVSRALICGMLAASLAFPLWAQTQAQNKPAGGVGQPRGPLTEEENPLLIGKRNINKHQINFYSLEKEAQVGRQFAADVDRQVKLVEDPIVVEYINRVGQNLVLNSDSKVPFTIKVVDTDDVNAFALPGGFFYVNKGLILAAENESELAGVMAHEIGHVAARHQMENQSKATLFNYSMIPLIIFTGGLAGLAAQEAASIAVPLGFLKFQRSAEAEADMLGCEYAWAAGYDPNGMLTFFEKIESKDKKKASTISKLFDTHPPTPERIEKVRNLLNRFPERDEYIYNTSDFNKVKERLAIVTNTHRLSADKENGPKRPTLHRKGSDDPSASGGASGTGGTSSTPASSTSTGTGTQTQDPAKPKLKRRDGSQTDPPPPSSGTPPPSSGNPPPDGL